LNVEKVLYGTGESMSHPEFVFLHGNLSKGFC